MKSRQFFKYTTWAMLVLNLGLISLFFFRNLGPPNDLRAIDTLKLDDEQHKFFLVLAQKHEMIIEDIAAQQKNLLRPYFKQLVNQDLKIDNEELLMKMQLLESQKITSTYQHFLEIKNILKEDQVADFEGFMDRMLAHILVGNNKNPKPPKDF